MERTLFAFVCGVVLLGCGTKDEADPAPAAPLGSRTGESIQVQYLEIVTPDVASVCAAHEQLHGVRFSEPIAVLGNARTADLPNGGRVGVRAPMRATEAPVVRPYLLVDDVARAVRAAEAAGAQIAHPPMELPGQGTFAIYILGGIEHGLWQR
jgi:predicted enzyme related to lactoylglutathione lyase